MPNLPSIQYVNGYPMEVKTVQIQAYTGMRDAEVVEIDLKNADDVASYRVPSAYKYEKNNLIF